MSTCPVLPNRRILDKHFVANVVSQPVKDYRISPGSKQGDNVAGHLLSVDVQTQSNEIHNLIFKSLLPMTGTIDQAVLNAAELNAGMVLFPIEITYYRDIMPMFREITDKYEDLSLFTRPKYYSGLHDERNPLNDYLALEDLRPCGYKMLDKFKGFNFEQMQAVMKELAKFHAVSYCLLNGTLANKQFCEMKENKNSLMNKHGWEFAKGDPKLAFNGLIIGMANITREQGNIEMANKIESKYGNAGFQIMWDLYEKTGTDNKYFPVLVHGDLWLNNILFKLAPDDKSVEDVKFIDFQLVRFGNIYEDLHYLIFTSSTAEFRENYLKLCLKSYFEAFSKVIKTLGGCPMPNGFSEEQLISVFYENWKFGAVYTFITIPYQLGIQPPPPSPMTPIDLGALITQNSVASQENKFFSDSVSTGSKNNHPNNPRTDEDYNKLIKEDVAALVEGTRNSPVALRWLKEVIDEMIEHDCI